MCAAKPSSPPLYLRFRPIALAIIFFLMAMQCEGGFRFFTETPGFHSSCGVQSFIEQEIHKPSKLWVQEVVGSKRESESVKLRTPEFVLLPDLNANRRQYRPQPGSARFARPLQRWQQGKSDWPGKLQQDWPSFQQQRWPKQQQECPPAKALNWLAIVADPSMRTIRDLRGEHVPMLERLYDECLTAIQKEYKVERHDVMVFANYPPSVYKLHFHFCAPFFTSSAYDAFRMHSLSGIINNLRLCSDYYKLSSFQVPVHVGSELFRITSAQSEEDSDTTE